MYAFIQLIPFLQQHHDTLSSPHPPRNHISITSSIPPLCRTDVSFKPSGQIQRVFESRHEHPTVRGRPGSENK